MGRVRVARSLAISGQPRFFLETEGEGGICRYGIVIASTKDPLLNEYWILNNTENVLNKVVVSRGGWVSSDDDVHAIGDGKCFEYVDVQSGEAVFVDCVHGIADSDYFLAASIVIVDEIRQLKKFEIFGKGEYSARRELSGL